MYINDLPNSKTQSVVAMYADDTAIMYSARNIQNIENVLNTDLLTLKTWLEKHKLRLNTKKNKCMVFGTKQKLSNISNTNVTLNDEVIEKVNSFKYLGVWLEEHLDFKYHIQQTVLTTLAAKCR